MQTQVELRGDFFAIVDLFSRRQKPFNLQYVFGAMRIRSICRQNRSQSCADGALISFKVAAWSTRHRMDYSRRGAISRAIVNAGDWVVKRVDPDHGHAVFNEDESGELFHRAGNI